MADKKAKILLCEDDTNLGMVLKNYLELNDFDVTLERDGRLGLAAFQRERFDLCLLDIMMPHMDGFTLAEEIRDVDPDIPLFFLSAKTMKEDIIQGYKLGADDYITKPFDSEVLLLKIALQVSRWFQVRDAGFLRLKHRTLEKRRQKAAAPVVGSIDGQAGRIGKYNIRW